MVRNSTIANNGLAGVMAQDASPTLFSCYAFDDHGQATSAWNVQRAAVRCTSYADNNIDGNASVQRRTAEPLHIQIAVIGKILLPC